MSILVDALQDAGCDRNILHQCRNTGLHVRLVSSFKVLPWVVFSPGRREMLAQGEALASATLGQRTTRAWSPGRGERILDATA